MKGINTIMTLVNVANEAIVLNHSSHLWEGSYGYEVLSELGKALEEELSEVVGYNPFSQGKEVKVCDLQTLYFDQEEGDIIHRTPLYFALLDDDRVKVQITEREEYPEGDEREDLKFEGILEMEELKALLDGLTLYHDHLHKEMESKGFFLKPEDIAA